MDIEVVPRLLGQANLVPIFKRDGSVMNSYHPAILTSVIESVIVKIIYKCLEKHKLIQNDSMGSRRVGHASLIIFPLQGNI